MGRRRLKEAGRPRGRGPVPGFLRTDVGSLLHPGAAGMQRNGTDSEGVWVVDFPFVVRSERREREASRPALEGVGVGALAPRQKKHFGDDGGVRSDTSPDDLLSCFF